MKYFILCIVGLLLISGVSYANAREQEDDVVTETVSEDLGSSREGSRTDAEAAAREAEAIGGEGLSVAQLRELRDKAEKHTFQAEVNRMMKLIINSLYKNKEIFLRELISNASDALDKLRLLSLTQRDALDAQPDMSIRIKAEPERKLLHIIDTGIGMTRQELVNNLGTIAKSGTADFLAKMQDATDTNAQQMNDMIGQFGVGFYSAFLVADTVSVASKHDGDVQHVWQSDAASFSVAPDPRGDTLKRGTHITLQLKDEALDFLQQDTIRNLVKKYSQFINFPIYLWASKTVTEEVPLEESTPAPADGDDDDAKVEDAAEAETKTKKVEKTVWDWEIMNDSKPIWTRKPADVTEEEYAQFYRSLTKDTQDPLARVHFVAEGEVTFKALLFVPRVQPSDSFNRYGTRTDNIKLFVRRVFITDEFNDMIPSYLAFIRGLVDSDDLPLNVSRETLQQHKLIKIIKKKLVRKVLDMLRKLPKDDYAHFWKEYSTNIKLGVIEDPSNRSRLAKLLRFASSATVTDQDDGAQEVPSTFLEEYVQRMKPRQEHIYYIAAPSLAEARRSPFAERLVRAGREVLYLTEAVDEYCINSLPEFEGKKFQNIAKEIFNLDESEEQREEFEQLKTRYEVLTQWLGGQLEAHITRAQLSRRLADSPCALVATVFGWTGNMERLAMSNAHQKANDPQRQHHLHQKKMLEINPRHPLIKELLRRVQDDAEDPVAKEIAQLMLHTATLRSGYMLHETSQFANSVENLMRQSLGIPLDAKPDPEEFPEPAASQDQETDAADADEEREPDEHDEL